MKTIDKLKEAIIAFSTGIYKDFQEFLTDLFKDDELDDESTGSFSESTFWEKVNTLKATEPDKDLLLKKLSVLTVFYSYLLTFVNAHIFDNARTINKALFSSGQLHNYIVQEYVFTDCGIDAFNAIKDKDKVLFIFDQEKHLPADISSLRFIEYRPILWNYIIIGKTKACIYSAKAAIPALTAMLAFKSATDSSFYTIGLDDCLSIKNFIMRTNETDSQKYAKLRGIHQILTAAADSRLITLDRQALNELSLTFERKTAVNEALSDGDFKSVLETLDECKDDSERNYMVYTITNLLAYTSFRCATILNLKTDSLIFEMGKYFLKVTTKTSNGKEETEVIPTKAATLIENQIKKNKVYRERFGITNYRSEYIFSYKKGNRMARMTTGVYGSSLQRILDCSNLNIIVRPSMLRHTYMTNLSRFADKTKLEPQAMALLTRHSTELTTFKNYVDNNEMLRRQLIATNNIEISGRIELKSTVMETVPRNSELVDYGCGVCTASECTMKSAYICVVCRNFVTTPEFEERIVSQIEFIDQKIINAPTSHDKEDFLTIKEAYVLTLEAIKRFKSERRTNA